MNKYLSLAALTAALLAASASAVGTLAGTSISNTASATFSDAGGGSTTTVYSNNNTPVTTSVSAVPSFAITPNSTGTPGTAGFAPGVNNELSVIPGQANVAFKYILENTGNVPNESYTLSRLTFNNGPSFSNVRYYLDNGDGSFSAATDTLITDNKIAGVAPDAKKVFFVVFDTAASSNNGQQMGLTPVGSRDASTYDLGQTFNLSDSDNYGRATVTRVDAGNLGPKNDSNADGIDAEAGQALPASYSVTDGAATTLVTYGATNKDSQTATAPAKGSAQTVTFINSVRNTGNRADSFTLTVPDAAALDAAGFPAGSKAELFKLDAGGNPTSTPLTVTDVLAADPDGSGPGLGGKYSFAVRVTLPANAAPDAPGSFPAVKVVAWSVNDSAQSDFTTDFVKIQSGLFGNATPGAPGVPAADPSLNPTKSGNPGAVISIPMDLYNSGNLTDGYAVSGSVTFTDTGGANIVVPIAYYLDANGDGAPDNATAVTAPSLTAGQELKLVGQVTVPAGAVSGTATISQSAVLKDGGGNTVITYADANDTISVGLVGGVTVKKFVDDTALDDTKTPYPAEPAYGADFSAYNAGSKAVPNDVLRYVIYARNERNAIIKNFVLSDAIPTNTGLWSVSASYNANGSTYATGKSASAKVLYKVGTGAWSATAPTDTTLPANTVIGVGYDWNGDATIDALDVLPAGTELKLVFKVKVK